MGITTTIPTSLDFPHRGELERDDFVLAQETAQDLLAGSYTTALNQYATELNNTQTEINAKAEQVANQAVDGGYSQVYIDGNFVNKAISSLTAKTTPVDADLVYLGDSVSSFSLKKLSWANLKDTIISSFGVLINGLTDKTTPVDTDGFIISDSTASNASKFLSLQNLKATIFGSPALTGKITSTDATVSVTSGTYTSSANVITVVLNVASHTVVVGDYIIVKGITNSQASTSGSLINFNGYFKVTAQTATTITYTIATLLGTVTSTALTGTITLIHGGLYLDSVPKIKTGAGYLPIQGATAYGYFNGSTTPPVGNLVHNISSSIRTANGIYDIYLSELMDTANMVIITSSNLPITRINAITSSKITITTGYTADTNGNVVLTNATNLSIVIFGGKN